MEQLFNLFLKSGIGLSWFTPELLSLDRSISKSDTFALLALARRSEATMSELAADLGAPLSTVTGIVNRLTKRHWLHRERSAQDRRAYVLRLTPEGQTVADKVQGQIGNVLAMVQEALTPEEMNQLLHLVQKVIARMVTKPAEQSRPSTQRQKIIIDD